MALLILSLLFPMCVFTGRYTPNLLSPDSASQPAKTFMSYIDHLNPRAGKFAQRYFELAEHWIPAHPKAILYFCGEVTCGLPHPRALPQLAASRSKALLYALEHRFYGGSQPRPDWKVNSLRYLTPTQAMADAAFFIETKNEELKREYGVKPKWVVISGSYPGALVAWFRYKYPHLAAGAVASSAVIRSFIDFPEFEKQYIDDLATCPGTDKTELLRKYTHYAVSQLNSPSPEVRQRFLRLFNATDMSLLDFAYFLADLPTYPVMLGQLSYVCDTLARIESSGADLAHQIAMLAEAVKEKIGVSAEMYRLVQLKNTTVDENKFDRQWAYQACTSFGWFQTPYKKAPLRWEGMDLRYWQEYCHEIFGGEFPDTSNVNAMFGGDSIGRFGSNIYFTQGGEDGWQWAGLRENVHHNPKIEVETLKCKGCAHCRDLRPERDDDPEEVRRLREKELAMINRWLE